MHRPRLKRLAWTGLLASAAAVLAACAAGSVSAKSYAGMPEGVKVDDLSTLGEPIAGWVTPGERFFVTTWGSSSCPPHATELVADAPDAIDVRFEVDGSGPCTADLAPQTHEFDLPNSVSAQPVTLRLTFGTSSEPHAIVLN